MLQKPFLFWRWAAYAELTTNVLYEILRLRQAVFCVEQNCAYQDVDGLDHLSWHLTGWRLAASNDAETLVAYARLVHPGVKYSEPSIGRVVTASEIRGSGGGKALMHEALARAEQTYPGAANRIGAQRYLERFYRTFGYETVSDPYDEDGIPHIEMLRPSPKS
jgi:ElaA protein